MTARLILTVATLALAGAATADAAHMDCTYNGQAPRATCGFRMGSQSTASIDTGSCQSPRRFFAQDKSQRVDLQADGAWIAPGTVRMRAYGSPLGALRVVGHVTGRSLSFVNRSRFRVLVLWTMTCP